MRLAPANSLQTLFYNQKYGNAKIGVLSLVLTFIQSI